MSLIQLFSDMEQNEWVDIPKGWLQGRTIFGGLSTAMMIHKATQAERLLRNACSVAVSVLCSVQDTAVKIMVEVLRQGKSVTTVATHIWQDDAVMSIWIANLGLEGESMLNVQQPRLAPNDPSPNALRIVPHNALIPPCD